MRDTPEKIHILLLLRYRRSAFSSFLINDSIASEYYWFLFLETSSRRWNVFLRERLDGKHQDLDGKKCLLLGKGEEREKDTSEGS